MRDGATECVLIRWLEREGDRFMSWFVGRSDYAGWCGGRVHRFGVPVTPHVGECWPGGVWFEILRMKTVRGGFVFRH